MLFALNAFSSSNLDVLKLDQGFSHEYRSGSAVFYFVKSIH